MPKKFGTSTKSAEARSRKEAIKQAEKEKKDREAEDALWKEDDKHVVRKQQRKDEKEKRKIEVLEKKTANKMAYEEEMNSIKSAKPAPTKLTRAEISATLDKTTSEKPQNLEIVQDTPLIENINRLQVEGEEARSVEDAIAILSLDGQKVDVHPEKRVKAAYQEFENVHLARLKAENPNLRLSQLKQMLKKDWMKSPDNPMNQMSAALHVKK